MTGKAVTRGRKDAAGHRRKTMPRAATRTGKKTSSARAPMPAAADAATSKAPARKPAIPTPSSRKPTLARKPPASGRVPGTARPNTDLARDASLDETRTQTAGLRTEDDDDLDWLTEEDDPRKQIVEDDEEFDTHHDEW